MTYLHFFKFTIQQKRQIVRLVFHLMTHIIGTGYNMFYDGHPISFLSEPRENLRRTAHGDYDDENDDDN